MSMNLAQKASSVLSIFAAMLLASCGDGGGPSPPPPVAAANSSVMGLWSITETSKTSSIADCQPPADPLSTSLAFVSQSGNNLTLMFGFSPTDATLGTEDGVFTGTITSGAVSLTGSHPDGSGNGTETLNISATVAPSCNSLTGSASFSFKQTAPSALSCTGTTRFSGTRTVGSGCTRTITNAAVAEQGPAHNTSGTAQTITLSSAITGTLPISNSGTTTAYDWYSLVLPATTPVTITLTGPAGQDIDLRLLASNGTTLIAASESGTSNESLSQSLAAGTYFIVVPPFAVTVESNYTLVVQ